LLSDRLGRRPVTLAALLLGFVFAAVLGLASSAPFLVLTAIGCLFAGVAAPLYGLGAGQTNDHLDRADFVGASGGLLFAWSLGASIGPTVAGATMAWFGPGGLFGYLTMVLGAVSMFTFARMTLRAGVPRGQQSAFVPGPAAPPRLAELAPRAEPAQKTSPIVPATAAGSSAASNG
jgi:MFS family permease